MGAAMIDVIDFGAATEADSKQTIVRKSAGSALAASKFVENSIYDALSCDDSLQILPANLAEACGGRSCVLWWRGRGGRSQLLAASRFPPPCLDEYIAAEHDNPWTAPMLARPDHAVLVSPDAAFLGGAFRQNLLVKNGDDTASCVGVAIETDFGMGFVAIHRGLQQRPFRLSEQLLLSRWKDALRRLFLVRGRMLVEQQRAESNAQRLNALSLGVLQVRSDGHIEYGNDAAMRILREGAGLTASGGFLSCSDREVAGKLSGLLARAPVEPSGAENCLLIPLRESGQFYRVCISPSRTGGAGEVLVLVEDCDRRRFESSARLERLLGLTQAEAQLAASLCEGLSVDAIAEKRGVSRNTARSQVQRVLEKAGVSRQAELVALLCSIPRAMSAVPNSGAMGLQR
jgi:DNA-binding CsgD family transcriptional regulator